MYESRPGSGFSLAARNAWRSARGRAGGGGALALTAFQLHCSGPAFELAPLPEVGATPDASGFSSLPPVSTASTDVDAARLEDPPGLDAGSTVEVPLEATPPLGPCGELRLGGAPLQDGEACIEAGSFSMGSDEPGLGGDFVSHAPAHPVTLSAYAIDRHEVTVARYRTCVLSGACEVPDGLVEQGCTYAATAPVRDSHPVTCLTWAQAQGFCNWDGGRSLPTEAQWERAARGSSSASYPWGEGFECHRAVLAGASQCRDYAGVAPYPVGSAPDGASSEGVMDLVGNAAEWVHDWFASYRSSGGSDPTGPVAGSSRVLRGGGWLTPGPDAVAYARVAVSPEVTGSFSFRCARSVP